MSTPVRVNLDFNGNQILNVLVQGLTSDPGSPKGAGQIIFRTDTGQLKVYNGSTWVVVGTGGTVTDVAVATSNGLAGTSDHNAATPTITLTTSVTGMLKGNGTAISAATSNTDYLPPASPAMTGTPTAPNASALTNSTQVANTAYADAAVGVETSRATTAEALKAPLASPTFTGTPAAPTATAGTNTTQVATTAFVTAALAAAVQGLVIKGSAVAATTGAETFTVASGTVTVISGTVIDGQSPAVNDLVLVKDAPAASGVGSVGSTQPGNGLYIVTNATTNLTISRATDMSGSNGPAGGFVFVEGGTANGSNGYVVSTPSTNAAFTYGTNNIKWTQFSGAGEITPGTGLSKTGNTLNVSLVPVAQGGTNQTSLQAAINSLLGGTMTAGLFARANGTNFTAQALQAADVPTNAATAPASSKYALVYNSAAIGDGSSTALTVTHSLNNVAPHVTVWDVSGGAGNFVEIICDVKASSANAVVLSFAVAPASSSIQCCVVG
jgi:hypothetical protein